MLTVKIGLVTKHIHVPRAWADPLVQPKRCKRDMKLGTWNVMILYRSGSWRGVS